MPVSWNMFWQGHSTTDQKLNYIKIQDVSYRCNFIIVARSWYADLSWFHGKAKQS
uniref:Uncharacterized protein n=1 Tax=Arundo donax TaxID=35708 RepID=A0A0A8XR62_ARUDO